MKNDLINNSIEIIKNAKSEVTAFTGAGISVESGIPPFRGENGLWNKYDPIFLDISFFKSKPLESWKLIKEIFYDFFGEAKPNLAHIGLAQLEKAGYLNAIITQNIDNLHQLAGSREAYEYHGNSRELLCIDCNKKYLTKEIGLDILPPTCPDCGGLLKPNFVFFGEPIPEPMLEIHYKKTKTSDVFLLIGTTGEIMPASMIPYLAKENGAMIIEINTNPSNYTNKITDIFLQGKATEIVDTLVKGII